MHAITTDWRRRLLPGKPVVRIYNVGEGRLQVGTVTEVKLFRQPPFKTTVNLLLYSSYIWACTHKKGPELGTRGPQRSAFTSVLRYAHKAPIMSSQSRKQKIRSN